MPGDAGVTVMGIGVSGIGIFSVSMEGRMCNDLRLVPDVGTAVFSVEGAVDCISGSARLSIDNLPGRIFAYSHKYVQS